MSVKTDFEAAFEKEDTELFVLMKERCSGAAVLKDMLKPSVEFLASVDVKTGAHSKKVGRLEWLIKNDDSRKGWGFDFEQFGIYHVKVRKSIPDAQAACCMDNRYMLVEILEEAKNEWLEKLQKHYAKPVIIENAFGTFELDRQFSWFEGEVEINDKSVITYMETDEENGDTAEKASEVLVKFFGDFEKRDERLRVFAAGQLTELANDWLQEDDSGNEPDEITEEVFAERIEINEVTFCADGELTLYYSDDDMFYGHSIEITVDDAGEPTGVDIVG